MKQPLRMLNETEKARLRLATVNITAVDEAYFQNRTVPA